LCEIGVKKGHNSEVIQSHIGLRVLPTQLKRCTITYWSKILYLIMLCYVTPPISLLISFYHAMLCYVTPTPISIILHVYVYMYGKRMNWIEWWSQNCNDYHDDLWL